MKRKRSKTENYQEDYLLNSLAFDPLFHGLQIHSFCHSFYAPQWKANRDHPMPFLLVYMILSGQERCTTSDGDYILQNPDFLSITDLNYQRDSIGTQKRKQPLERYFVLFHTNRMLHDVLLNLFPKGLPNFKPLYPLKMKRCFEDIRRVLQRSGPTDGNLLGAMGYRLLAEAASQMENTVRKTDPLTMAQQYIENNFCDPALTRKQIASAVGINQATLGRLFRAQCHMTVNQYVISLRLKKARFLLDNTDLPIAEIAKECGFAYAYYFSRIFKARIGVLPGKYRNEKFGGRMEV